MSIFDRFADLAPKLFDAFELPPVKIERTTTVQTKADKAAGRKGTANTVTTYGRGALGKRSLKTEGGTIVQQSVIRMDKPVKVGDKLTIGTLSPFIVVDVEEVAPNGLTPILFIAVLK